MQNSQVWTSAYRSDHPHAGAAAQAAASPEVTHAEPSAAPPTSTSPAADPRGSGIARSPSIGVSGTSDADKSETSPHAVPINSPSSRLPRSSGSGIWSPLYGTDRLRAAGGSFGAYGAYNSLSTNSSHRSSDASQTSFDSELYRNGGMAWGSAARHASFPSTEPAVSGSSPNDRAPFFTSLSPLSQAPSGQQRLDFTGPSFSLLERFSTLADATRAAEGADVKPNLAATSHLSSGMSTSPPGVGTGASAATNNLKVPAVVPEMPAGGASASPPRAMASSASSTTASAATNGSIHGTTSPQTPRLSPNASPLKQTIPVPIPKMLTPPNEVDGTKSSSPAAAVPSSPRGGVAGNSTGPGFQRSAGRTAPLPRRKRGDSPLLDHFRSPQSQQLDMSSVLGRVMEASTDQHGSRFIQDRLATSPEPVRRQFFVEALPHILALATDVFGNYVVQLLIEQSSPEDQEALIACLKGSILALSLQMYGCRVVQIALRHVSNPTRLAIVAELQGNVIKCVKDHNGNHVVQKAIEFVSPEAIGFIYDDILEQPLPLARHMYGCRVIQRALEYSDKASKAELLRSIRDNLELLTLDQYGNYVVQHVVENGPFRDREFILAELIPRVVTLSGHKFASNVIEKCFIKGSPPQRKEMVRIITTSTTEGTQEAVVLAMMRDQYANYVIQRILGTAKNEDYDMLAKAVKKNLPIVKKGQYGKHLQAIERRLK